MIYIILMVVVALVVLGLLVAMMLFYRKREFPPTDYYALFIMGIGFTPLGILGITLQNPGFFGMSGMGIVFMVVGLLHKKEWKKNHKTWNQLSKEEQQFKMWIIIVLGVLVVLGALAFFLTAMLR